MKRQFLGVFGCILLLSVARAQTNSPSWPSGPLTLRDVLEIALRQNPAILKGKQDIEESQGLSLDLRSTYKPRLRGTGRFTAVDSGRIESVTLPGSSESFSFQGDQNWNAEVQVSQPIYAGGRLKSAHRQSKLTTDAALANYKAVVADALLQVRITFDDVLFAAEQITVNEASVRLLEQELADTRRRYEAGVAPRFNVLRAEVELANAKPRLFRARSAHRTARNILATHLGWTPPKDTGDDIPIELSGKLTQEPHDIGLSEAIQRALAQRSELQALRMGEKIRDEEIVQARAGYYPTVGLFAGYGWQNQVFPLALNSTVDGWSAGAQMNWEAWDFGSTKGKVNAARARRGKARIETEDAGRQIELQVRTAHSNFLEAREVLESQARVIEQGEEALRLANARAEAGTGTQLDVLSAQTALTDARTTYSRALRDYAVAWARLERAMGDGVSLSR